MKRFITILLAVIMIFSMTACRSANNNPPAAGTTTGTAVAPGTTTANAAPVTLKFANYALLEKGYEQFWNGVKSGFEAKYTNVKIDYVTAPYGEIVNQVINMAGSGNKVDIILGEIGWTPTFENAGLSVPVDTILSPEFLGDFYPDILKAHYINGKPYAVPMYVSPFLIYYNKELFTKAGLDPNTPPKTYDEMLAYAAKLSKLKTADGNKVYAFGQTTASVPISGSSLTSMVYNFGGQVLTPDGKLNADTTAFKEAFTMLKLLNDKGYNPQNAKLKDLRNLFALGQLAIYYDQSWGFNGVSSINPDAKKFTASAPPMAGGNGKGESILQAATLILVNNGPAQAQAIKQLVEYIISPEVLNDYLANVTPAYPARQSMKDISAVTENTLLKGAAASLTKTVPTPFIPALDQLNLELSTLAQAVTVGGKSVDEAIANFKTAATAIVK